MSAVVTPPSGLLSPPGAPLAKVSRTLKEWRSDQARLAVIMVGLPARGKTYIARRITRYLRWTGFEARWYNVGNHRREKIGAALPHEFFNADNAEALTQRHQLAAEVLDEMIGELQAGKYDVGVFDATNSTRARREWVRARLASAGLFPVFVESVCNIEAVIEQNIRETKLSSPDYAGMSQDDAVSDFKLRIKHYEDVYEPIDEDLLAFVKYIDLGRRVVLNRIVGYLPMRLAYFIQHLQPLPRAIYLTRHGESEHNSRDLIGGDSALTQRGIEYARRLGNFLRHKLGGTSPVVFTSTLKRTQQTAAEARMLAVQWAALDEINAGALDSLSYEDIERTHPLEFEARARDKLRYRYPRGESYEDVIDRLETVIMELERSESPVVIIGHQAINRALLTYFRDLPVDKCPTLNVPLGCVIELIPRAYYCEERHYYLDSDDVASVAPQIITG